MSNKQPAHKIHDGLMKVTIWGNAKKDGNGFYSVALTRSYKDGETWHTTNVFSGSELLKAANLLQQAYNWIMANKPASTDEDEGGGE